MAKQEYNFVAFKVGGQTVIADEKTGKRKGRPGFIDLKYAKRVENTSEADAKALKKYRKEQAKKEK